MRTITTRLAVDGEAAFKKAITGVNAELRVLRSELTLSETQFKGQANTLDALKSKQDILSRTYEQQAEKVRALEQAVRDATEAYGASDTTTLRYQNSLNQAQKELLGLGEQLEAVNGYMKEAEASATHTASSIDEFGNRTKAAGDSVHTLATALAAAGVARGIDEIAKALLDCVDASKQFQSDFTGVAKTVEGTEQQMAELRDGIKQMSLDIPATTTAISKVAESAGQLGIARENVLDFTRVMIDLDETTDLTAENGAKSLARFANVTRMQAEDYSRLGSVIVDLGNNFATSESEITAMGTRLAAAGTLAKMTQPEILALGAAMSSVGIEAEAGGTAMTQTLTAIESAVTKGGSKLAEFARIAGMSSQEFSKAWNASSVSALQAFIAGLARLDQQGESATLVLDELGLSGIRQSNMLKSLALASDQMTGAIDRANQAWAENTALTTEASKRYADDAAKFEIFGNAANNAAVAVGDALRPALGDLAEAGTEGFAWAAEFIEENPWLVQAIAGVTAALGIFAAGIAAYEMKTKAAAVAQTALNAAMNMNPAIAITSAIVGLTVAMSAFASSVDNAVSRTDSLMHSLTESSEAYQETIGSIQEESAHIQASISVLEELAAAENKTAAQKESIRILVDELNQSVPNLALAYNEQTDSLNMTADAVRRMVEAEAERQLQAEAIGRMTELYKEQAQIEERLAQAQEELNGQMQNVSQYIGTYGRSVSGVEQSVQDLTDALAANQAEYDALAEKLSGAGDAAERTGNAMAGAQVSVTEMTAAAAELEEASLYAAGAQDTLADALKEQTDAGSLSLDTTLKLIEAGYGAALAIDTETGSVTLDKAAYIELAQAKIDDQLASLETQKQAIITAAKLAEEEQAAQRAGSAYWSMAGAKAAAEAPDTTALDAQIAALKRAREALGSYSGAAIGAARSSGSASKAIKTQAQQDLEAYKNLKAELDHQKAMDLVSEQDYYDKLKEYRDQYLTDKGNLSEYRRVTEQIYEYDKQLAEDEAGLWAEQTEALTDELENRVQSIQSQRKSMEQALSGYGDLFTVKDDRMSLESIQEQIDAINRYEEAMTGLRERGLSQDLLDEILAMNVDEATEYGEQLLAMSDSQWEQYNALWDEKQLRAAQVAEEFYKNQLQTLELEYNVKLEQALEGLTNTAFQSGEDTAQGLIDGLASKEEAVYAKARAMEQEVARILRDAWKDIPSNAEIAARMNTTALQTEPPATAGDVRGAIAAGVNGLAAQERPLYVTVKSTMNVDSREFFTQTLPVQRAVARANPETMDDK